MPVHENWRFEGGGKSRTFEVVIKLLQCIFGNDSWIKNKIVQIIFYKYHVIPQLAMLITCFYFDLDGKMFF